MVVITKVYQMIGDWEGLYIGNELFYQEERLSAEDIMDAMSNLSAEDFPIIRKTLTIDSLLDNEYGYPNTLTEFKSKYKIIKEYDH